MHSSLPEVLERCRTVFEGVPPFGPLLRERFADRWLRLSSLPDDRRPPLTAADKTELLARQNLALATLLGDGADCVTSIPVSGGPLRDSQDAERTHLSRLDGLDGAVVQGWAAPEVDVRRPFQVELARLVFQPGLLDARLLSAAEGRLFGLVVIGLDQHCAFAPFPGGFDVIAASKTARESLRRRWEAWAPKP